MWRDFTYIDDIVDGVLRALDRPPSVMPPHAIYNLGNHKSEKLTDFIAEIEKAFGQKGPDNHGAHAARRCACNLRQYRKKPSRTGFRAHCSYQHRNPEIHRVVQKLLPDNLRPPRGPHPAREITRHPNAGRLR